ncbi:heme ABC transporter substrate-binding protein IsdE [Siminovitchia terrae]|uniref:High-affinity heme uptake system protein IsdE n=1 Tax=Siminovitchia terrae TaxID=1914933 RepID=A0A429XFF1_SIMTE|nr:heme ABC transporter substrate-binding protein IsdE [Siminovitchia terrae]RST61623.1 heme ABC transporter substrate-binding protein IsdE [Siminovitchia terrae]GIN97222.1 heme ABC transporter substrate-binding protein IsdE [Siminovitchia terrae]
MKRKILVLLMVVILLLIGCSAEKNAKKTIKENNDPENNRIVATTVAVTEIMDALEIDLIGIPTSYKKLPERYKGITEVGNPMSPDMELIMSLQPKEVMSVTTLKYDLESVFDDAGINTRYVNLESIDDMYSEVLKIGEKYQRQEQAEKIVNEFDEKLIEIERKIEGKPAPKVLILMGVPGSYLVATDRSYIGDLVEKSGGINVFSGEKVEYLASNTEYLQQSNPDIILRAAHGMPDEVVEMFDKEFKENDIWKHFDAVKNNRIYDLEETLFGTTGNLAASEALDVMVEMLYSE